MRLAKLLALTTVSLLLLAGAAQAAIVVVGSPLTKTFNVVKLSKTASSTILNRTLPSGNVTSPINGVVVGWNVLGATGGPFAIDVIRPGAGVTGTSLAAGEPAIPTSDGLQSFPAKLPIQAGDAIGLDVGKASTIGGATGISSVIWEPPLTPGETREAETTSNIEFAFNAEVQPPPTLVDFSPLGGPASGGTTVTIVGTDFARASAVHFGTAPAAAFTVVSETQITATTPAGSGTVPVSVTTGAGTVTAAARFTYPPAPAGSGATETCRVPRLRGKTLKAAKKRIRNADCRVGRLTKKEGATARNGEVVKQVPKPGTTVAADTKVQVTLAP